ncbi:MAG: hypothetical protein Q4D41_08995 [Prevotellaceae bacterium]|nr:hypothetical protein [Prevotellaceae bacterium]
MKEEYLIEQKFGKENHFTVPEGYFNDFEKRLLENIPVEYPKHNKARVVRHRWISVACAACIAAVAVFGGFMYMSNMEQDMHYSQQAQNTQYSTDNLIDEVSDYAMFDNGDFYSYVANE